MTDRGSTPGEGDWSQPAPPPPRFDVPPAAPAAPPQYVPGPPPGEPAAWPPTAGGPSFEPPASWSPAPPTPTGPSRALVLGIIALVALVVVPLLAIVTVWIVGLDSSFGGGSPAPSAPTLEADDSPGSEDSDTDEPDTADAGSVESTLQAMIDDYRDSRADGSLWGRIPKTEFNETAVTAFLYLLTDLKLAASFGADTSGYLDRAAELERKLLAEEPLGTNISIVLSDRTFTYDGETGAGGFTDN